VGKIELVGLQDEKIWIELSNTKLATLGVPLAAVQQAMDQQNAIAPASFFETPTDRVQLRVSGRFTARKSPFRSAGDRNSTGRRRRIRRGFADPAAPRMRYMGRKPSAWLCDAESGDIIRLGAPTKPRLQQNLPIG
jgi:multidrug efflux pump